MSDRELKINVKDLPESIQRDIDLETGKIRDFISGEWVEATPEEVEAVQLYTRRLYEDYDYQKNQIQVHPQFRVRKRPSDERKEYPVDIAVFRNSKKIEDDLFMIVECKQPERQAGLRQLKIYLDLSPAVVGVWFNGKEHAYIRKVQKMDGTIGYIDLPNIPQRDQRIEDIGLFKRKDLRLTRNLKPLFKDIRNHLAPTAVGMTRDETLAQEIINLLFCKIYDENTTGPEEIVTFRSGVNEDPKTVADRVRSYFAKVKNEYSDIFDENDSIGLDDKSINYVVGELQNFCITEAERDVVGDAFEVFIGPALKGPQGQFFTPRNVVKLAVNMLDPDPNSDELLIDPACGTGGFLIVALEYIWNKIREEATGRGFGKNWITDRQQQVAKKMIRGIDKDNFLSKVTKAYMAIIRDGRGGIFCEDSLSPIGEWKPKTIEKIKPNSFNIVLTNPPFGAKLAVKEREILKQFEFGYKFKKKDKGRIWDKSFKMQDQQPPQILFIERCLELLRPGGKMAIVLPDGVLGGSRIGYIPYIVCKKAKVLALIDLPRETFQPSVATKTHLVFLQKKTDSEIESDEDYKIFMAIADYVGHDRKGRPIFTDSDEEEYKDDLPKILKSYKSFKSDRLTKDKFGQYGYVISSRWLENYFVAKRYLPKFMDALEELEDLESSGKFELKTIDNIKRSLFTGANINADEYLPQSDYRYLMTDCITEFGINPAKFKYISKSSYTENKNKVTQKNDIVINRAGNAGITTIFPDDMIGVMACGFTFVLRLKSFYDPYYVAAFLNSRLGKLQTERFAFGSILDHITKDDLENVIIPFPKDVPTAERIVNDFTEVVKNQMKARLGFRKFTDDFEKIIAKKTI